MSTDFGEAYKLLGVTPGVPVRELKAAYRDLAKVWHPDRFLHDPGLREKAQEKLKEINAAYELLISGKTSQPRRTPPRTYATQPPVTPRQSRHRRSHGLGLAFLMFMAVFAVSMSIFLQKPQNHGPSARIATENTEDVSIAPENGFSRTRQRRTTGLSNNVALESSPAVPRAEPLATVSVEIDPYTGLLATPNCPVHTRMTYPDGNQPQAYCNARHSPKISVAATESEAQKESVIKSFAKRVAF